MLLTVLTLRIAATYLCDHHRHTLNVQVAAASRIANPDPAILIIDDSSLGVQIITLTTRCQVAMPFGCTS